MSQSPSLNPTELLRENQQLRLRLQEAEELLSAIRSGEVDALAVQGSEGTRIFTLQGADQAYRTLIEGMNEGALLLDGKATILYANSCLAALLECELPALIGTYLWEWIHVDYRAYLGQLLTGGWQGRSKGELALRTQSGRLQAFSLSMSTLSFDETPVLGVILTDLSAQREIRTVQAQVQAQNQLLERQDAKIKRQQVAHAEAQRLNTLLAQAPVAMAIFRGPAYVIELANEAHLAIWGRTPEQVLGKPFFEALPEAREQGYDRVLDGVLSSGEPFFANELPALLERSGRLEQVHLNFVYQPLREADGTITGVMAVAHDITDQVTARRRVEAGEKRFRTLLESIPQMTWTNLPTGEVSFFNRRWYDYTGLTHEQTKDWGWQVVIHPEDLMATVQAYRDALETGQVFTVEHRYLRGWDGAYRWHLSRAVALRDEAGAVSLWVGTATDIHEQKQLAESLQRTSEELTASNHDLQAANQQLIHINVDLDNFIYTASHDLKAPIANIEGLLLVLKRHLSPETMQQERVRGITDMIASSVERFKKTIANLTDITRLQKENGQAPSWVELPEMIGEIMLDLAPLIGETKAQVQVDVAGCPVISFQEKNLRSILYNLLSNALKYRSPEREPRVEVGCQSVPGYLLVWVSDNGLGIDLSKEQKLFAMFGRLHTHVEGSGVGLYMVKKILDNAGGKIEVESQVGVGSTFRVYFKQ